MAALELVEVSKSFGSTSVLRNVCLSVEHGEFVAVVGPSGCGKSTLLRIIAGLEQADAGDVRISDASVMAQQPGTRDVAMVFQSYALYPHMTVRQNIALPLVMRDLTRFERMPFMRAKPSVKVKRADIERRVVETAAMVGLEELFARKPRELSGGQRQRVALARALVRKPRLFLLDEPLSNLDAGLRISTRAEIVDLQRRLGIATILVTHDQGEAMAMASRIVVLMAGTVAQEGSAKTLYEQPASLQVATFIGSPRMNVLPAEVAGATVRLAGRPQILGHAPSLQDGPASVGVRAEDITLQPGHAADAEGVVRLSEFQGSEELVHLEVHGGAGPMRLVARLPRGAVAPSPGSPVALSFDRRKLHLFGPDGRRHPIDATGPARLRVAAVEPRFAP